MRVTFIFAVMLIALAARAASPVLINSNAAVALHPSAKYGALINLQPGQGEIVSNNPPTLSWFWAAAWRTNDESHGTQGEDRTNYLFRLRVSTNSNMSAPLLDVNRMFNNYAWLPPLTNGLTYYWAVSYMEATNTNNIVLVETNSFSVAASADKAVGQRRFVMANPSNYFTTNLSHPYLWFKASNHLAMGTYMTNNNKTYYDAIWNEAATTIASAAWTNGTVGLDHDAKVLNVAFCWQATGDARFTNGGYLGLNLQNIASEYFTNRYAIEDTIGSGTWKDSFLNSMAYGYDWAYDALTTGQRASIIWVLEDKVYATWQNNQLFSGLTFGGESAGGDDTNRVWASGHIVCYFSGGLKHGSSSHQPQLVAKWMPAWMAILPDSSVAQQFADFRLGWTLLKGEIMGGYGATDEGVGYGSLMLTEFYEVLHLSALHEFLPELELNKSMHWTNSATWWPFIAPVGYSTVHPAWGDQGGPDWFRFYRNREFHRLAQFVQSGTLMRAVSNDFGFQSRTIFTGNSYEFDATRLPAEYYSQSGQIYTNPPIVAQTNLSAIFPRAGWVFANSRDPTDSNAFSAGVGMAIAARPKGYDTGTSAHGYNADGSFALWAYGSPITDGGAFGINQIYPKLSMAHYLPAVNGYLQAQSVSDYDEEARAYISGYETGSNYVFAHLDLTKAYPHTALRAGGLTAFLSNSGHNTNPIPNLQTVERSVLFVRNKYWVFCDHLKSSSASTYSWIFQVPNYITNNAKDNISFTQDGGTTYTNGELRYVTTTAHPNGSSNQKPYDFTQVTNIVKHIYDVGSTYVIDCAGSGTTNIYFNPILGIAATNYASGDSFARPHVFWVQNTTPATERYFIWVHYPWPAGSAEPTITRLDDTTVAVTNGADGDVITFGTNALATLQVNFTTPPSGGSGGDTTNNATSSVIRVGGVFRGLQGRF